MKRALLLSGGMDSTSLAYWIMPELAITIDYGQRAAPGEIRAATAICRSLSINHEIIRCDLSALGSGDMAGTTPNKNAPASEWWPFRNQMLVTIASMLCVGRNIGSLAIGALTTDGRHVDGRKEFFEAIDEVVSMQEGNLRIEAPAIDLNAEELVNVSGIPLEQLAWSHSCHVDEYACGFCRGCKKHFETFQALGHAPY